MRGSIASILVLMLLVQILTRGVGAAQSSSNANPADKVATSSGVTLPSEATVDSFMQQTFGYEPN
ncbi:MAG TPA: hypothetical protein VN833_32665, partial [Candidatus Acidoferrales bacterium]|nr:hypothetical protein [Candidatus Acidoferrales bacterium]